MSSSSPVQPDATAAMPIDASEPDAAEVIDAGPAPIEWIEPALAVAVSGVGLDLKAPTGARSLADGTLETYAVSEADKPTRGAAEALDVGFDGEVAWGRWAGGTPGGAVPWTGVESFGENQGFHYALAARPAKTSGIGVVTFKLVGHSSPTLAGSATKAGTVVSAALRVRYRSNSSPLRVGLRAVLRFEGEADRVIETFGGTQSVDGSELGATFDNRFSGSIGKPEGCVPQVATCVTLVQGMFAGTTAKRVLVAYSVRPSAIDPASAADGVLVFAR